MLDIVFNNFTKQHEYDAVFFRNILERGLEETNLNKKDIGLSVNIVDSSKMKALNMQYRGKDTPTDVLSFPLEELFYEKNITSDIIELGDIFICLEIATQNVKEDGKSLEQEVRFLTVHGFLHLLGYDHEKSAAEKKKMFALQDKILQNLK